VLGHSSGNVTAAYNQTVTLKTGREVAEKLAATPAG